MNHENWASITHMQTFSLCKITQKPAAGENNIPFYSRISHFNVITQKKSLLQAEIFKKFVCFLFCFLFQNFFLKKTKNNKKMLTPMVSYKKSSFIGVSRSLKMCFLLKKYHKLYKSNFLNNLRCLNSEMINIPIMPR